MSARLTGRCLCGGVAFSFPRNDLKPADACHCGQCRRWSGYLWGSVSAPLDALSFDDDATLKWFQSSKIARRGFCSACGSSLFWHANGLEDHKHRIAVSLGALDGPTGLKVQKHIFVADGGDYYEIADGLPQELRE